MKRGLAAVVVSAAAALAVAAPTARAQVSNGPPVGTPLQMSPAPDKNGVIDKPPPYTVSGDFQMGPPSGVIEEIDVTVKSKGPQPGPNPDTKAVCQGSQPPCGQADAPFTYQLPGLPFNGPYEVTAFAYGSNALVSHQRGDAPGPVDFKLAVPPATPTGLKAYYDASSTFVIISWDRNKEPDLDYYLVYRKGPGDKHFNLIGKVGQPPSNPKVTVADGKDPPGEYQYSVVAYRAGADPSDQNADVPSAASPPVKVSVPTRPPDAPQTQPGSAPPAPVLKPVTSSQVPKHSGSLSSGSFSSGSFGSSPSTTENVSPDAGFNRGPSGIDTTIPGAEGEGGREGQAVAVLPRSKGSSNALGVLGPVAGGALLFVVAFQLRWLKNRLDQPPNLG